MQYSLGLFYQSMNRLFYLAVCLVSVLPIRVLAESGGSGSGSGSSGSGTGPNDAVLTNPLSADSLPAIVDNIVDFLLALAGPIAILMLVYAGYLFVVGGTNENNIKKAKQIILWSVVGIAVLVLSKSIVYVTCNALGVDCTK